MAGGLLSVPHAVPLPFAGHLAGRFSKTRDIILIDWLMLDKLRIYVPDGEVPVGKKSLRRVAP